MKLIAFLQPDSCATITWGEQCFLLPSAAVVLGRGEGLELLHFASPKHCLQPRMGTEQFKAGFKGSLIAKALTLLGLYLLWDSSAGFMLAMDQAVLACPLCALKLLSCGTSINPADPSDVLDHLQRPPWGQHLAHGFIVCPRLPAYVQPRAGEQRMYKDPSCSLPAPSCSLWLPFSAPCRIRPFLMNWQVIIVFPCLAFNVSWQKINELTGFQQVLWSKTRACQHRQNIKCVQQGSLSCLFCVCTASVCAGMKGSEGAVGSWWQARGKTAIKATCGL